MADSKDLKRETLALKDGHVWKSREGYRIFVAGGGALRFDVPTNWVLRPDHDSFKFHDREPPDDDCILAASFNRIPPLDWKCIPIDEFLQKLVDSDSRGNITFIGEPVISKLNNSRVAWSEHCFIDPVENREAYSRMLLGFGGGIQCLVTMDYWPEDAERVTPVWDEMLRTLKIGDRIPDPTTGRSIVPFRN